MYTSYFFNEWVLINHLHKHPALKYTCTATYAVTFTMLHFFISKGRREDHLLHYSCIFGLFEAHCSTQKIKSILNFDLNVWPPDAVLQKFSSAGVHCPGGSLKWKKLKNYLMKNELLLSGSLS